MTKTRGIAKIEKLHNHLVKKANLNRSLLVNIEGGKNINLVNNLLHEINGGDFSDDDSIDLSIVNFCVSNVYWLSNIKNDILNHFRIPHIFGKSAVTRYKEKKTGKNFYERLFLSSIDLTKLELKDFITDGPHPLAKFIYPLYADRTKKRKINTEVGYYICTKSTTLYAPESKVCQGCIFKDRCNDLLKERTPELHRLRNKY